MEGDARQGFQRLNSLETWLEDSISRTTPPPLVTRIANLLAFCAAAAVHAVWWALPLPGRTPDVAARHDTPMTPVGWTFWVWIPILVLQGFGVIFQALPRGYKTNRWKGPAVASIGIYWQLGWYAQIAWEVLFSRGSRWWMVGALAAQLLATAFFATAYTRLHKTFCRPRMRIPMLTRTYAYLILPTVMNLAWLTVMSAMGLLIVMKEFDVDFSTPHVKAVVSILAIFLMLVGAALEYFFREVFYGAVITWAFLGILIRCNYMQLVYIVCLTVSSSLVVVSVIRKAYGLERVERNPVLSMGEKLFARIFMFKRKLHRTVTPAPTWEEDQTRAPLTASIDV
eukprot:evm.model.scf_858.3 EVM.evm.TU.scf_858.3   scf_858:9868-13412(-)